MKTLLLLATALVSATLSQALPVPPPLPAPVIGMAAATGADGTLYVVPGDLMGTLTNAVYAFTPGVDTAWRSGPPLPEYGIYQCLASGPDGTVYCIGGFTFSGISGAYALPPGATQWETLPPLPGRRVGPGFTVGLDGTLYVIAGSTTYGSGGGTNTVLALEPGAADWEPRAPLPDGAGSTFLAAVTGSNGLLYATGGLTTNPVAGVWAYDPLADTWLPSAPLPEPRILHAAVTGVDGTLYVIGGGYTNGLASVLAFNPASDTDWAPAPPLPEVRYFLSAAPGSDGTLYALGGVTDTGTGTLETRADVFAFTPGVDAAWRRYGDDPGTAYEVLAAEVEACSSNPEVTEGLLDKLAAAEAAEVQQNWKARNNILKAFANQVKAQTGKAFTEAEAAILLEMVEAMVLS